MARWQTIWIAELLISVEVDLKIRLVEVKFSPDLIVTVGDAPVLNRNKKAGSA